MLAEVLHSGQKRSKYEGGLFPKTLVSQRSHKTDLTLVALLTCAYFSQVVHIVTVSFITQKPTVNHAKYLIQVLQFMSRNTESCSLFKKKSSHENS